MGIRRYSKNFTHTLLNDAIGEHKLADLKLKSFEDYLFPCRQQSMYLEDCTPEEVMEIVKDFDNSKSSDIPIRVIKKSVHVFSHTLSKYFSRISQHKSTIKRGEGCKILRDHFTKVHEMSDMSIMPIKLLPENSTLKERENIEESCMLQLNTVFPYGLNVRVKKNNILDAYNTVMSSKTAIYSQFDVVKINRFTRGTGGNNEEI